MGTLIDMRPNSTYTSSLLQLVESMGRDDLAVVEVGVYRGQGTKCFLDSGKVKKIYCIDPWISGYDPTDIASSTDMVAVEADFDKRVGDDDRVVKLKGTLQQHAKFLSEIGVDVVYIDACHQYESAKDDIETAVEIVKPKIAVCGHDYVKDWSGVVKAVDEVVGKPDKIFSDYSWVKYLTTRP